MSERDPELDALWRAQSHDEPPPALDDAIRAAAHRAVHAQPVSTNARARSAWPVWAGFAAAASIGAIAIGVWQLQPRDVDETKVVASDVPPSAAAPRPPSASKPAAAPTTNNAIDEAQRRVLSAPGLPPADVDRQALAAAAPPAANAMQPRAGFAADAAGKPSPFPNAGTDRPASPGETTSMAASQPNAVAAARAERSPAAPSPDAAAAPRAERGAAAANAGAPAPARAAKTTVAKADKQASAKTTGDYIAVIRRALAEHRDADARAALTAMRAEFEFADAALPDDLAAWAKRVPRVTR